MSLASLVTMLKILVAPYTPISNDVLKSERDKYVRVHGPLGIKTAGCSEGDPILTAHGRTACLEPTGKAYLELYLLLPKLLLALVCIFLTSVSENLQRE